MKENTRDISKNYAKALYQTATNEALRSEIINDIQKLLDFFKQTNLKKDLTNPILGKSNQKELLTILSRELNLSLIFKNFLCVLADNGRLHLLKSICDAYQKIYLKEKDIIEVEVETAISLTDAQVQTLTKGLTKKLKKEIILHQKLNEQILGGLILRYQSFEIDDSIKGKIQAVEKMMKGL